MPISFGYIAAIIEAGAVVGAAYVSSRIYSTLTLGLLPEVEPVTSVGVVVALLVGFSTLHRGEYDFRCYLTRRRHISRAFAIWNLAFFVALALGFATKTTSEFSRGAVGMFYFVGFAALALARRALIDVAVALRRTRLAPPRRVIIVGFEDRLEAALRARHLSHDDIEIVCAIALRDNQAYLGDDLALALAAVRMLRPDDVGLSIPWSRADLIEACADVFLRTPAEIHVGADPILDRFGEPSIARLGGMLGLKVTRTPLTRLQRLEKRAFDLVLAIVALIVLTPILGLVALLIRYDSCGPALFRQKRYGFNQEPFRIFKFRTMTTMEDGPAIAQATRGDPRITRMGGFLRRHSIDELPQLLNVLSGEMSIVGPRPHALAHDQRYVERLARYARRHNVKPGISGWAQVHGHRGEIKNDEEMQARLERDLYYVDNWSLWLDCKIVLMTIFAARPHRNAF